MEGSFFYDVRCNEASAEWPVNRFANRSILRPRTGRRPSRPKIISNSWRASWTVSFIATLPTIERGTGDLQTKKPRAPVIRSSICYAWRTREGEFLRSSVPFRSKLFVDEYLSNVTWTALPIHRSWSIVVFRDAFHSSESSFQILSRNGLTNMLVVLESMGGRLEIRKTSLTIDFSRCSRDVCPYLSLSLSLCLWREEERRTLARRHSTKVTRPLERKKRSRSTSSPRIVFEPVASALWESSTAVKHPEHQRFLSAPTFRHLLQGDLLFSNGISRSNFYLKLNGI